MKIAVFDLDGTLCNNDHRKHYIDRNIALDKIAKENASSLSNIAWVETNLSTNWRPDWKAFNAACDKDTIYPRIKELYDVLDKDGYIIVILTGRSEEEFDKTMKWLEDNGITFLVLRMRAKEDYRPDDVIKPELLESALSSIHFSTRLTMEELKNSISFIIDDRASVVKKWRELGYTVLQVAEGNF